MYSVSEVLIFRRGDAEGMDRAGDSMSLQELASERQAHSSASRGRLGDGSLCCLLEGRAGEVLRSPSAKQTITQSFEVVGSRMSDERLCAESGRSPALVSSNALVASESVARWTEW